ncbi:MAG: hypothetical protein SW833_24085 [Cyanobacteriota bacterium]|nr:hypothetical protein [Cyanobacteriota bacterium]
MPTYLEHINKVFWGLTRGESLTRTALEWHNPAIGQTQKKIKKDDKLRGIQWRLVIAYSGFEITVKALMNCFKPTSKGETFKNFIQKCDLPNYSPLTPPQPREQEDLEKWLSKGEGAIAKFLGVNQTDTKVINRWMIQSNEIASWEEAFKLAKALRNASAHGFLSPSKAQQWELEPALRTLADDLGTILAYGLKKLT